MSYRSKTRGQSTVEMALLLPILAVLFFYVVQMYQAHYNKSEQAIVAHNRALVDLNHGKNDGPIIIDGVEIAPGHVEELIPSSINFGNMVTGYALSSLTDLGLNAFLNKFKFFDGNTYVSGFARGYTSTALTSLASTGKVDWKAARVAGYVGALSSLQATEDCQGANASCSIKKYDAREFFGSGLQGGLIAYANTDFKDPTQFLGGAAGGMLNSDTANHWFESGNDVLKGAARGAISSSIAGAMSGNLNLGDIAKGSAMGAFYTNTVAEAFPWANVVDPKSSATFQATNAALSSLMSGGKGGNILLAAASGAFGSGQIQHGIVGDSKGLSAFAKTTAADAAFVGGAAVATGDASAAGEAMFVSAIGDTAGAAMGAVAGAVRGAIHHAVQNASTPEEAQAGLAKPESKDSAVLAVTGMINGLVPLGGAHR